MSAEALDRIDAARAALAAFDAAGPATVLQTVPALAYALRSLIPEPPRPQDTSDDEPSREEYREGYEAWRTEGRRMHAALLDIWRMAEPTDTSHLTYGDDPAVVVAAVRALFTPTDDEREALARRLLAIDYACAPRQVAHHQRENSEAWRQALVSAGDLMASPEWRNRHRGPINNREYAVTEAYNKVTGQDEEWTPESILEALYELWDKATR